MGNMSIINMDKRFFSSTVCTCILLMLTSLSLFSQIIEVQTFGGGNSSIEENVVQIGLVEGASLDVDTSLQESEIDIETTSNNLYVAQLSENNAQCLFDSEGNAIHFELDLFLNSDFRALTEENLFYQIILNSSDLERISVRDPTNEYLGSTIDYIGVVRECDGTNNFISLLDLDEEAIPGFEFDNVEFGINSVSEVVSLIIKFRGNIINSSDNSISSIDDITVFPNPAFQNFRIKNCEKVKQLEIYNLEGKLINRQSVNAHCEFESKGLRGLYFLRLITKSGEIINQKIQFL